MNIMSMVRRFTERSIFGISLILIIGIGCARTSNKLKNDAPNCQYLKILQAVLDDGALKDYAKTYFEHENSTILVWDDAPVDSRFCSQKELAFLLTKSSEPEARNKDQHIVISRLYLDDDAAFVELSLYPTGMNGDFFLRNKNGWRVTQRSLWESR